MELIIPEINPLGGYRFQVNQGVSHVRINSTIHEVRVSGDKMTVTSYLAYTTTAAERQETEAEPPKKIAAPRKAPYSSDAQWKRESSRKFR